MTEVEDSNDLSKVGTLLQHEDSYDSFVNVSSDQHENKSLDPSRMKQILQMLRKHLPRLIKERSYVIEKNAKYAKLCIMDAFQGRLSNGLATNSKKSKLMYNIFYFQTCDAFMNTVIISSFLHTLSVFLEPVKGCSASTFMFMFHVLVAMIHLLDVVLKMSYEGFWGYWSHDWQRLYIITVVSNILDLCINGCTTYTNFLRPVVWLLRARSGRRFFTIVQKMIPGLTQSLMPMFVFMIILMAICAIFFDNSLDKFKDAQFSSYNWFWMIYTNDTFDALLPPELYEYGIYIVFFFSSIFIGQKFLLSLILGATFDTFRAFTKKQLKDERIKEIQGLVKAFAAVDDQQAGIISEPVFRAILSNYRPSMSLEEKSLYYELLSNGKNSGVTILQFLNLRDIESYKFTRMRDHYAMKVSEDVVGIINTYGTKIYVPIPNNFVPACKSLLKKFKQYSVRDYANFIDMALVVFGMHDYSPSYAIGLSPCMLMSAFYYFEFYITLISKEGHLWSVLEKQELFALEFLIGNIGILISYMFPVIFPNTGLDTTTGELIFKFQMACRFLRCLRICRMSKDLSTFINAMIDVMPLFLQSMSFAFVVIYIFAMGGNLLFGPYVERFSTPMLSMVAMNQLFLPASFVEVMEEVMEKYHPLAMVYFTAYFILSLIICNLSLSIIIEWYSDNLNDKSKAARKSREASDHQLFMNIMNRAMGRKVMSGNCELYFKDIRFSRHTSSDHRVKLVGTDTVDLDDLKKCQKYSNIDLTKMYNAVHRHHKDVNMEVEFIRRARESDACTTKTFAAGEELFRSGEEAANCYLVISGIVLVTPAYNPHHAVSVHAVTAVGYDAMQPQGVYSTTCVAEADVECLVFSQDNIAIDLDPELSGILMRIAFNSHANFDELVKDKVKMLKRKMHKRSFSVQGTTSESTKVEHITKALEG